MAFHLGINIPALPEPVIHTPLPRERRTQKIDFTFESIEPLRGERRRGSAGNQYRMEKFPHGIALIINNKTFINDTREGAEFDERNLIKVFQYLGYIVHVYNDCTSDAIENIMEKTRMQDHTLYDSFVCCILSHGGKNTEKEEYIIGSNNKQVIVDSLIEKVESKQCKSLASKPKIFFIQACRGTLEEQSLNFNTPINVSEGRTPAYSCTPSVPLATDTTVAEKGDVFIAYATPPGYVAWRHKNNGSYYIIELCRAIALHSISSDLTDIVTAANEKLSDHLQLSKQEGGTVTQTIQCTTTLKKKVFF